MGNALGASADRVLSWIATMVRIGELLLQHGWVDQANLHRALAEQALAGGKRICSLLIARGLLDPDLAARALGEQHDVAAVLQKHLDHCEPPLASLLPPALARSLFALPIGHTRAGELIVCVRDPSPDVAAALRRALDRPVVIAIAPASQLEKLIDASYEDTEGEFDVDLTTGTQLEPIATPLDPAMPDLTSFALVELDDVRVTKDHSQSAYQIHHRENHPTPFGSVIGLTVPPVEPPAAAPPPVVPKPPTTPPPPTASLSIGTEPPRANSRVVIPPIGEPLPRGPAKTPTTPQPLILLSVDEVVAAIADAVSRDTATDVAVRYATQRWTSSLLLAVKEGAALGHRGHGKHLSVDAVRAVAIPLSSPSIIKSAHDNRALVTEIPPGVGAIHERLLKLLGSPKQPMAAPIIVAGRIACILAVGDALGPGDPADELARLAEALGAAYQRILRDMK